MSEKKHLHIITSEEVKHIEQKRWFEERNYAIMLLATCLGLQASDIANLKFSNIIWEENKIILTQHKTKAPIVLLLLTDVGNAIVDYLKHGRKKSTSQNILISCNAPISSATKGMICGVISQIIKQSGVTIGKRRYGPYSMRHSLATILMENEVTMPVISDGASRHGNNNEISQNRYSLVTKVCIGCCERR